MIKFFDPAKGYASIKPEIDEAMQRVLGKGDLILREEVEIFEKRLADFVGTKHAVGLNSGTDAIYLALKAIGTGEGDEVIVPAYTFKSTIGAILNTGAKPILMDLDGSYETSLNQTMFLPVHISGEKMTTGLKFNGFPVVEDACQALDAVKNPTSLVQCWSFYPAKILGAYSDAGAVTTNSKEIYEYIKDARNHFKDSNKDFGINSRLSNLQATILNVKFNHLKVYLERRKYIAKMYLKGLKGVGLPNNQPNRVWQDFIIRTPKRDELYDYLKEQDIETLKNEYPFPPEYPKPPLTAKYEAETLRLPCSETITNEEVEYIISKVNEFVGKN